MSLSNQENDKGCCSNAVPADDEVLANEWPYLTRQQVYKFKAAFDVFDTDNSGTLTANEINGVMRSLGTTVLAFPKVCALKLCVVAGQYPTPAEVESMVSVVDADGNNAIDFAEFLTVRCFSRHLAVSSSPWANGVKISWHHLLSRQSGRIAY
eukprot:1040808-Prorocentrum_minimum.AAC.3